VFKYNHAHAAEINKQPVELTCELLLLTFHVLITSDLMPDIFLDSFDEALMGKDFNNINEVDKAEPMQRCIVKTCGSKLKKVGCSANDKFRNYWWNSRISELKEKVIKANRKVTREKKKRNNKIEDLLKDFKEKGRKLKKEKGKKEHGVGGF
jgi:hypothetical protein